jgi:hypothetical protein
MEEVKASTLLSVFSENRPSQGFSAMIDPYPFRSMSLLIRSRRH